MYIIIILFYFICFCYLNQLFLKFTKYILKYYFIFNLIISKFKYINILNNNIEIID